MEGFSVPFLFGWLCEAEAILMQLAGRDNFFVAKAKGVKEKGSAEMV